MNRPLNLLVAAVIAAASVPLSAQQREIEETFVTAMQRAENIQDVPVSVVAVSSEQMERLNIVNMRQITEMVPNVELSDNPILTNIYMRGMGAGRSQIIEQSVGLFVDGIYQDRSHMNLHPFFDVTNVEVLRGPQGSLFGKNTVAGALIVRTGNPTDELEGSVQATLGDYNTVGGYMGLEAYVSGPITDTLSYRVAASYNDTEGFVKNRANGPDGADREDFQGRFKLRWDASDQLTVSAMLEHNSFESDGEGSSQLFNHAPDMVAGFQALTPTFVDVKKASGLDWENDVPCDIDMGEGINSFCPSRDQDYTRASLQFEYQVGGGTFSSLTAYQAYDYDHNFVTDAVFYLQAFRSDDYEGISQEFKFTSELGDKFDYIAGIFLDKVDLSRDQTNHLMFSRHPRLGFLPDRDGVDDWVLETESIAVFGQLRWHFSDAITGIFGGRWYEVDKTYDFLHMDTGFYNRGEVDAGSVIVFNNEKRNEDEFTPSFTLQWSPNDDMMFYYAYAEGSKTGGFDDRVLSQDQDLQYDSEASTLHEIGMKSNWLDGAISFNATIFHQTFEDLQVASEIPGAAVGFLLLNAAESTSDGVELELNWYISESWTLGATYGYLDATYDEFEAAPCRAVPHPECVDGTQDLSGEVLAYAPESKWSATLTYDTTFGSGWGFGATVNANYSDEYYGDIDLDPLAIQESYTRINASARIVSPSENWVVSLIGRNLTEEKVMASSFDTPVAAGPGQNAYLDPPRELAVQLTYSF